MESNELLKKEGIRIESLSPELRNEFVELTKEFANFTIDGKEIPQELIEKDNKLSQKINEWLNEDIDESEEKFIESEIEIEKTLKEKILSVAEKDKVMIDDLIEILGRNPKYPLEQIEDLRLVKILHHPYYQIRNYKELFGKV